MFHPPKLSFITIFSSALVLAAIRPGLCNEKRDVRWMWAPPSVEAVGQSLAEEVDLVGDPVGSLVSKTSTGLSVDVSTLLGLPIPEELIFCDERVPLDRDDVLERLDLELVATLGSPVRTTLWLKRMPRHFPMIEQMLREKNLPDDIKYLALVESNLRADALSSAGATGPWQFMRATGNLFGLKKNAWSDPRRDWTRSTRAALDYLGRLYEEFGNWPLAMAAYNAGRGRVKKEMERQGESDYYGLVLPRETERYVFKILAAKLVAGNPEAYGIDVDRGRRWAPEELEVAEVRIKRRRMSLAVVADAANTSYRNLKRLNPWMNSRYLPKGEYALLVPQGEGAETATRLAEWENKNPEPKMVTHRVRSGDTLSGIARNYRIPLKRLLSQNELTGKSIIRPGQKIMVGLSD